MDKIAQIVVCGVQYCLDVFHDPDDLLSDAACDCSVFLGSLPLALKQTETHTLSTLDRTDLQGAGAFSVFITIFKVFLPKFLGFQP